MTRLRASGPRGRLCIRGVRAQHCSFAAFLMRSVLQSPWQRLVKRMTRFFTKLDADGSYRSLRDVCEKMGYGWKQSCTNQVGPGRAVRGWG